MQLRQLGLSAHKAMQAADLVVGEDDFGSSVSSYANARPVDVPSVRILLNNAVHGRCPGLRFRQVSW